MEQEFKVGIIGAGPAGCAVAYFLQDFCSVILFDSNKPLQTLLPTGGGRCNFAHAEYDFKNLVANYPRGEKFLYSVFSKFSTMDAIKMFEDMGIQSYTQDDGRIFPISNSSKNVRENFLKNIKNADYKQEKALRLEPQKTNNKIKLVTDMNSYIFDFIVFCTGGHNGYDMIERIGVSVVPPRPALVGLNSKEDVSNLAGITINNVSCEGLTDSLLFTHKGVSGPLIFKISSLKAREEFPYILNLDILPTLDNLQDLLNLNPHKQIDNLLSELLPKKLVEFLLNKLNINPAEKCHNINGNTRDSVLGLIHNFELNIISVRKDGEIVTSGGVDLKMVNPKTLESKEVSGLYFAGEVLDIDGFCGGFNLQNCWSTAFVVSEAIKNK